MALYTPATIWEKALEICKILRTEDKDGVTNYIIEIRVSLYKWHVSRRYKQFVDLHEKMVKEYSIDKNLLPPKRIFGNRTESFINERKKALELYLHSLIHQFNILPEPLALFLDFEKYEVRAITAALSETLFSKGEEILSSGTPYEFNPLHLYAITERLKLGDPTCYSKNPKQDIAHLVEFVTQLQHLIIVGNSQCFGVSNIVPNELCYDLSLFKNAEIIEFYHCKLGSTLTSVDTLRTKLKSLIIHKTLSDMSDILLCGIIHWCPITDPTRTWPFWSSLTSVNFSHNKITKIHPSIKLLLSVKQIDLSHNEIQVIEHMETLSELSVLNLSHNKIQDVESLHTRLGNINSLNLSSNKIKSLQGFCKLFSVSQLILDSNLISSLEEVSYLSKLPCLEVLNLQHNPVNLTIDYRPQVLLLFGPLASELLFDGRKATEKEIDTVSILQALKQARGESSLTVKSNVSEDKSDLSKKSNSTQVSKYQEQNSPGGNTTKKLMSNFYQSSKFRQRVETLRKIGGSDWLRLLNEIHNSKVKTEFYTDQYGNQSDSSSQNKSVCLEAKNSCELTSQLIETLTSSFEISYPDWLLSLDASSLHLEFQLPVPHFYESKRNNSAQSSQDYFALIKKAKMIWGVLLDHQDSLIYEVPICVLISQYEIVFLQLKSFSKSSCSEESKECFKLSPEFLYARSVSPHDIHSLIVGPCDAYIELRVKTNNSTESIIILMMDVETTAIFVSEFQKSYNITPSFKLNPFSKKMLEVDAINADFCLAEILVQKQIIFGQRVCVSKALHKCQHGVLHYAFITPSHVVLVEERMYFPHLINLDITTHPQFQICSLINVHTNVKQIHLKDVNSDSDTCTTLCSTKHTNLKSNLLQGEQNLDLLYKCGSWLIIEFDSNILLYLNFFSLKQRNDFLDSFLCVRNQR